MAEVVLDIPARSPYNAAQFFEHLFGQLISKTSTQISGNFSRYSRRFREFLLKRSVECVDLLEIKHFQNIKVVG